MNGTDAYRRRVLHSRFADREDIGKEELYRRYFGKEGLPKAAVFECLDLIEEEYEIPAGLLRPEDEITKLTAPVETRNIWRWMVYQVVAGDREGELSRQLGKRMRQHGTFDTWGRIKTLGDLIRAWSGQRPK
jgi:hypothetical protein